MFHLPGQSIAGRRDALDAIGRTHDETMTSFQADDDLEDAIDADERQS